jgi:hypothetical protein
MGSRLAARAQSDSDSFDNNPSEARHFPLGAIARVEAPRAALHGQIKVV